MDFPGSERMTHCDEGEDYWLQTQKAAKNLFDDDQEDTAAKQFAADGRKNLFWDDEDTDSLGHYTVDIVESKPSADSPAGASSVKYQRAGSARVIPSQPDVQPPPVTEAWKEPSLKPVSLPSADTSEQPQRKLTSGSITDVVAATVREPTKSDVAKLEAVVKRLQLKLETQSVGTLSIEETIKRMLTGQVYLLESYRSLDEKRSLLRQALATHDGNAVNAVILFLKRSLTQSLFQKTLLEVGGAEQYVSYLKQVGEVVEAEDMVAMIGKSEEAAMTRYKYALTSDNVLHKIQHLKNCQKSHFELDTVLSSDCQHLTDQISLLEIQRIVEKDDELLEAQGRHQIMRTHKRRGTLPNHPALTTLYYSCLYHYDEPPNNFSSPRYLMQHLRLTDSQLQWVATAALARIYRWSQLEQLFAGKKWYGGATMTSVIGFHNVVKILSKNKATPDVLNKYCSLIADESERLEVAQKYSCNSTAINTLIAMKDRTRLVQFMRSLPYGTPERQKADAALNNSSIKWRS